MKFLTSLAAMIALAMAVPALGQRPDDPTPYQLLHAEWKAAEDVTDVLAEHLRQGRIAAAETFLQERLAREPKHDQARFALGVVRVLSAIEKLGQDHYRYGALSDKVRNLPVVRLPVPDNPDPEPITYGQTRQVFADFQTRLLEAEAELAKVDVAKGVRLPLDLAAVRLDLTGSKKPGKFLNALLAVAGRRAVDAEMETMPIVFDSGDVPWLRGYCHLLAGFCDFILAYDHQRLFDHVGQLVYPRHVPSAPSSYGLLDPDNRTTGRSFDINNILDYVAAIHLAKFPLEDPARMEAAREHLLETIRLSRDSWKLILAETDDDHEWLPNPRQTGVLQLPVRAETIDGWHAVLAEMEELLEGRKLAPFWRDVQNRVERPRGFNLKRFFAEPRDLDLVLLIQGTDALPYVEAGELSDVETWRNLTRVFGGNFWGFALWFN